MSTLAEGLSQLYESPYLGDTKAIRVRCSIDERLLDVYVVLAKGAPVVYVYAVDILSRFQSSVTATPFNWLYSNKLDTAEWELVVLIYRAPLIVLQALIKDGLL